jgi:hypothetical protein
MKGELERLRAQVARLASELGVDLDGDGGLPVEPGGD